MTGNDPPLVVVPAGTAASWVLDVPPVDEALDPFPALAELEAFPFPALAAAEALPSPVDAAADEDALASPFPAEAEPEAAAEAPSPTAAAAAEVAAEAAEADVSGVVLSVVSPSVEAEAAPAALPLAAAAAGEPSSEAAAAVEDVELELAALLSSVTTPSLNWNEAVAESLELELEEELAADPAMAGDAISKTNPTPKIANVDFVIIYIFLPVVRQGLQE